MHSVLLTENDEQLADQWAGAGHESFSETEELEHGSLSELLQIRRPGHEARRERLDVSKFRSMYRFADKEKDDPETLKVKCGAYSEEQTDDLPLYDHDGAYLVREMACSSCKISPAGQTLRRDHFPVDARIKITMYRTGVLDAFYTKNPHAEGVKEWQATKERRSKKYGAKLRAQRTASRAIIAEARTEESVRRAIGTVCVNPAVSAKI
jgi:hypothetical protein